MAKYREFRDQFGPVFVAEMGAEAILKILKEFDLEKSTNVLVEEIKQTSGQRRKKAIKRLRVIAVSYTHLTLPTTPYV